MTVAEFVKYDEHYLHLVFLFVVVAAAACMWVQHCPSSVCKPEDSHNLRLIGISSGTLAALFTLAFVVAFFLKHKK